MANVDLVISRGARWETFTVPAAGTLLRALQQLNRDGAAIAYTGDDDAGSQGPMVINGVPELADVFDLSKATGKVFVEPMRSFPLIEDLKVDLSTFRRDLEAVDGLAPESMKHLGALSNCLRCGLCQEASEDYTLGGEYMGPAPVILLDWQNQAPDGQEKRRERMALLVSDRGVHHDRLGFGFDVGCPNELALKRSVARAKRDASWFWLKNMVEQ